MELSKAKEIALGLWRQLKPFCEIIKIAGSIRREKPEVKDIEIVALPKTIMSYDMFGGETGAVRVSGWREEVLKLGIVEKGKTDGKYMQLRITQHEINLDLFMPDEADYFRQLVVRTGPSDYSHKIIAGGWRKQGWVGTDFGLRKKEECENIGTKEKPKWKVVSLNPELPPRWESEQNFYQWLRIPYIEPKYRSV